jgi:hypothetical protein
MWCKMWRTIDQEGEVRLNLNIFYISAMGRRASVINRTQFYELGGEIGGYALALRIATNKIGRTKGVQR